VKISLIYRCKSIALIILLAYPGKVYLAFTTLSNVSLPRQFMYKYLFFRHIILLILLSYLGTKVVWAQAKPPHRALWELQILTENDVYLFDITDEYYSNGIQLSLRKVLPESNGLLQRLNRQKSLVRKVIVGLQLNHNIYTPHKIFEKNIDRLDRPYAGWLFLENSLSLFLGNKIVLTGKMDVGVTGRWSGGEEAQKGWHQLFGMDEPRNWDYQIRNAVVAHGSLLLQRQLWASQGFDLISETTIQGGALLNNARQGFFIRLGNMEPIYHTLFTYSRLDQVMTVDKLNRKELYFFLGATLERVFTNGLIDGPLQGNRYLKTGMSLPWVEHYRWGMSYGNQVGNISLAVNHLSPEFRGGRGHSYASVEFGLRF
jgi:lipid A 3-O-deacylase